MIRFAPVAGLVLASPVVLGALSGARTVDEALLALLVGIVAAAVGLHVLGVAMRPAPPAGEDDTAGDGPSPDATGAPPPSAPSGPPAPPGAPGAGGAGGSG